MNLFKKKKIRFAEVCFALLLLFQFLMIMISNLTLIDSNLDCDNAKMFKHIITMWEQRTLVIPNWSYPSTLEWDCSSIFALFFYGLTKNIYLSCGLSNILLTAVLIGVIFFLFKDKEMIYPLVCANLICIPYRFGMLDYYNMMFFCGSQYIVKIMVPILFAGLILAFERERNTGKKMSKISVIFAILYIFLLLVCAVSSGIYVAACGLFPVCAAYACYKFLRWEKVPLRNILLMAGTALCALAGMSINMHILENSKSGSMTLGNAYQLFGNMTACFVGILELLGGITEEFHIVVFSLQGIAMTLKICLVILFLVCGMTAIVKCMRKHGNLRMLLLITAFIWNFFILNITETRAGSSTFEYRYHLIGMIPLMCVSCIIILDGVKKLNQIQQGCILSAGGLLLLFLCGTSYLELFTREEQYPELKEFVSYCEQFDVEYVYMYDESNEGDICRLLSEDKLYLCVCDDGTVWAYDYYEQYVGGLVPSTEGIVAVRQDKDDFGDEFMILGYRLIRFDTIGDRSLYYFAEE